MKTPVNDSAAGSDGRRKRFRFSRKQMDQDLACTLDALAAQVDELDARANAATRAAGLDLQSAADSRRDPVPTAASPQATATANAESARLPAPDPVERYAPSEPELAPTPPAAGQPAPPQAPTAMQHQLPPVDAVLQPTTPQQYQPPASIPTASATAPRHSVVTGPTTPQSPAPTHEPVPAPRPWVST